MKRLRMPTFFPGGIYLTTPTLKGGDRKGGQLPIFLGHRHIIEAGREQGAQGHAVRSVIFPATG